MKLFQLFIIEITIMLIFKESFLKANDLLSGIWCYHNLHANCYLLHCCCYHNVLDFVSSSFHQEIVSFVSLQLILNWSLYLVYIGKFFSFHYPCSGICKVMDEISQNMDSYFKKYIFKERFLKVVNQKLSSILIN